MSKSAKYINDKSLKFLKQLIKESIALEKKNYYKSKNKKNIINLQKNLISIPDKTILKVIKRHRLIFLFIENNLLEDLLPSVYKELSPLFYKETHLCLLEASITRDLSLFLNEKNIKHLFLKGIPLALQTTGSIIGRGASKDIDILVEPCNVLKTIEMLQKINFQLPIKHKPFFNKSLVGKYSRYIDNQLILFKDTKFGRIYLDLHWRISPIRSLSKSFNFLYESKNEVTINNYPINTLNKHEAFISICHNTFLENWMCMRPLIDINRLSNLIDINNNKLFKANKIVKRSCAITYEITKNKNLRILSNINYKQKRIDHEYSKLFQSLEWRSLGKGNWSIFYRLKRFKRFLQLGNNLNDWLTLVFEIILPARDIVNIRTGKNRNIFKIILIRIFKFRNHKI